MSSNIQSRKGATRGTKPAASLRESPSKMAADDQSKSTNSRHNAKSDISGRLSGAKREALNDDSNKEKTTNSCDMSPTNPDGDQATKQKRVNLIKKTSISFLTNRRSQLDRLNPPKKSSIKENESKDIVNIKSNSNTLPAKSNNLTHHLNDARKSQKLVVSLIKDISRTVSKEELDEMMNEIYSVISDNRQENESSSNVSQATTKSFSKKRQDIRSDKLKKSDASNSGDVSNLSELKRGETVPENDSRDDKAILPIYLKHNDPKKRTSDVRKEKLSEQLMELSSDEDNSSKNMGRKPNSSRLPNRYLGTSSSQAKYISPHRKQSLEDRLNKAQETREQFLKYRANKYRDILKKVEEMRACREEDTMNLKVSVQTKLQKAEVKRKEQLEKIIRKAHDEDSKVSEIHFINNLEAQNRRHDMNSRKKDFEARLQELQDERQRRSEEKQAKEIAAEEKRKNLEAERRAKLLEIQQKRELKNQKVEQQQQVKEKRRIQKNRDRDQKITAIKEAYNVGVQSLRKRINQKQEQSERRHEVNLRLIRQKAFELSIKRYNSFVNESNVKSNSSDVITASADHRSKDVSANNDTRRLQLKPFTTKKFCNLCKETISSELALFSHLRSESHHWSITEHYGDTMLTTNEAVEIHNLRHLVDTDEPIECDKSSEEQQSSRASSLVNYYHSSYLSQTNGGICMSESDRESLLMIEKKCRKLRHKLIVAGKSFNRDWFTVMIRHRLAELVIQQRMARNLSTNTDESSLASTIDLSANNVNCQQNKAFYLKINRIGRELVSVTTDQRISGGGLMPAGIIHSVDRLLADLSKQLNSREIPKLVPEYLYLADGKGKSEELDPEQLATASKMIEFYAIDTLFLFDTASCLVSVLRRMVPNVSLTSKLPSTVASHYSTLIDPISLNSYYCHRLPILPARIYMKIIGILQSVCYNHSDLCCVLFQSNNMINLSDILSYRLGFIIGNESPASSISGSSSAATLSGQTAAERKHTGHSTTSASSFGGAKLLPKRVAASSHEAGEQFGSDTGNGSEASDGQQELKEAACEDAVEREADDEGDFWERAPLEDIVDDMTAGLCKLLATVNETILARPLVLLRKLDKTAFDKRSDDFISYMVSVGIVDTESVIMSHIHQQHSQPSAFAASNAGTTLQANSTDGSPATRNKIVNFTTACIQFVTSLVKLVAAKLPENGHKDSVAQQEDPTQLLATLRMTQVSGALTLVYELLVRSFGSLARPPAAAHAQPPAEPARQLELALRALRLVNHVAYIDLELLQSTVGADETLPLQLRHVCSYLISYLLARPQSQAEPHEELLNEVILLLGHFAYLNPSNQLWLKSGQRPTIIEQLVGLPFEYFSREPLKLVLMPTLISCAYLNDQICALVSQELSLTMLASFIEEQLLSSQLESKQHQESALHLTSAKLVTNRWSFERRFAKCKWLSAKKYFESQEAKTRRRS